MGQQIVILDNIRSAYNVGAIFRTADGAGVTKLYLVGTTPDPIDRFGRNVQQISKTSLGACETVLWEHVGEHTTRATTAACTLIDALRADGYTVIAIEQTENAQTVNEFAVPEKVAYIFGAEVDGVQSELIAAADKTVEIPMHGTKESLNVSVTAGIVLFHTKK